MYEAMKYIPSESKFRKENPNQDGYFYIDKTAQVYQMVKTGSYYFWASATFRKDPTHLYLGSLLSK